MAVKLTVTVAVLLFVCTVAFSRTQLDLGDEDVALPELPKSEPKATTVLLLPSQNPETAAKHPVVVTFRPINRQFFPRRPLLPVGPRHRCRHGHKMMKPRFYGNDMIVSGWKDHGLGLDDKATRGAGRQIPVKRARISFFDGVANGEEREWGYKKRHHSHLQAKGEEGARKEKHEHKWGLLKGIRKFLKQNF
ncbi:hypothetical protein OIU74_013084 [Salix koriyanagi]|uniref:Uncharacterized protein n=1 Tax=Salix koriyanagi TaxID=2511006 RepID=A0A9Q0Q8C9_9ROSI|nr:hypothetical protein OIU74_013084 [Salix koriyanagi]